MRKILKIGWIFLRSVLLFVIISYTTIVIVEHIEKQVLVETFKKNAVFQENISTDKIKYYRIDYDGRETLRFNSSTKDCIPGNEGDIMVSVEQNTVHPLVNGIISFYAGGHAGYIPGIYSDSQNRIGINGTIEASMTVGTNTACTTYSIMDWTTQKYFNEVMCLRVDMTDEERKRVDVSIAALLGDPYNETFFFNTKDTSYCSDVISKGFKTIGKNLNPDGVTTSIWDLIVAKDTYITYYHYFDSDGVKHVYYLG